MQPAAKRDRAAEIERLRPTLAARHARYKPLFYLFFSCNTAIPALFRMRVGTRCPEDRLRPWDAMF